MALSSVKVTPWAGAESPSEEGIRRILSAEGLPAYGWSNAPFDLYGSHSHSYNKVIYVVRGSITFTLGDPEIAVDLTAGERLDLPSGTLHSAKVGADGVECLEAHF